MISNHWNKNGLQFNTNNFHASVHIYMYSRLLFKRKIKHQTQCKFQLWKCECKWSGVNILYYWLKSYGRRRLGHQYRPIGINPVSVFVARKSAYRIKIMENNICSLHYLYKLVSMSFGNNITLYMFQSCQNVYYTPLWNYKIFMS